MAMIREDASTRRLQIRLSRVEQKTRTRSVKRTRRVKSTRRGRGHRNPQTQNLENVEDQIGPYQDGPCSKTGK